MNLPKDFLEKMQALLKNEYEAFVASYEENKLQGLRVNTLKVSVEDFLKQNMFQLEQIPWVEEGFYYPSNERPGKHAFHEAGLYYIQEPSAMAVGGTLDPQPGERILDLCGAPGGKSTHVGARLKHEGFLLANEIHPARAKILAQNVERMGIRNCVVTNETPEKLAQRFPGYFHRILVDAPCSGEGMFRKDPEACEEWSLENVALCASRQLQILEEAGKMLMPGGRLVYSTCTFAPEENEGVIDLFLKRHPEYSVEDAVFYEGFKSGRKEWVGTSNASIEKTIRLWPHHLKGEGHFVAVLTKTDGEDPGKIKTLTKSVDRKLLKDYFDFGEAYLNKTPEGQYILFGEQLYIIPREMVPLENLKVLRPGWHLGAIKKSRFEPSHALALSLTREDCKYNISLGLEDDRLLGYLKGEALSIDGNKGWNLVHVEGYSLGWGKLAEGVLKNHYPKGLRWTGI
ncbi:NOL1/NOP2/sun family putative RNA methylase [Anaerosolibacter carboniphilus]|uniref:NOL1/NOP2/sun family putative RNA methylase n=1 Tax=Anaerosolibacter carboniphilus TaxID=1417629 RepID=A0A841KX18_9FIRM|nr:RsmB/NOP family class I SAM-dependent RNA methyltransferase [Anaerosolibacter carboniphilus]MBB6214729.1 NOL1/NOP2/sun family putative RNA methylase [Anaerosolibacter carboniphilus]